VQSNVNTPGLKLRDLGHTAYSEKSAALLFARSRFLNVFKVSNLDSSFGELGCDFQFATQSLDKVLERTDIHIRPAFELGYSSLVDTKDFGQMHLGQLASLPEFVESHP